MVEAVDAQGLRTREAHTHSAFSGVHVVDARDQGSQIAEVTAVQLKIGDLLAGDHAARLAGLCIDLNAGGRHGHFRLGRAHAENGIDLNVRAWVNNYVLRDKGLEALFSYGYVHMGFVRGERENFIAPGRIGLRLVLDSGGNFRDRNGCIRHNRTGLVGHHAENRARGGGLAVRRACGRAQ